MDLSNFKWLNESKLTKLDDEDAFTIYAPPNTDFFNNPDINSRDIPQKSKNAPYLYTDVEGDFVARVRVTPDFISNYDAGCIFVYQNEDVWFKICFEKSDFGTNAVVSVVTNGTSDDANGCNIDLDTIWLQVLRVKNVFALHYSLDGNIFDMVRLFSLPIDKTVKVGLVAQSPIGTGARHKYENFTIENRTVNDLRKGE